jgi:cardiolipin synthase A/B
MHLSTEYHFQQATKLSLLFILLFLIFTTAHAKQTIIVEPNQERSALLDAINGAQNSIKLTIYGFTDDKIARALIQSKERAVDVAVLIEATPYLHKDENTKIVNLLKQHNISVKYSNPKFFVTHQKTFVFDDAQAWITTFNLTHSAFSSERNFALVTNNKKIISELNRLFQTDWQRQTFTAGKTKLVISPNNSRKKLANFVNNCNHKLYMYISGLTDLEMMKVISKDKRSTKILFSSTYPSASKKTIQWLCRKGMQIHQLNGLTEHAKVIISDTNKAYLGSINLTRTSLDDNREVEIITEEKSSVATLLNIFNYDWNNYSTSLCI